MNCNLSYLGEKYGQAVVTRVRRLVIIGIRTRIAKIVPIPFPSVIYEGPLSPTKTLCAFGLCRPSLPRLHVKLANLLKSRSWLACVTGTTNQRRSVRQRSGHG